MGQAMSRWGALSYAGPLTGPKGLDDRLAAFFRRRSAAVADPQALTRAGFTAPELNRAVARGILRRGVTGYWLRQEPDPGAMLVMNRQRRHHNDDDEELMGARHQELGLTKPAKAGLLTFGGLALVGGAAWAGWSLYQGKKSAEAKAADAAGRAAAAEGRADAAGRAEAGARGEAAEAGARAGNAERAAAAAGNAAADAEGRAAGAAAEAGRARAAEAAASARADQAGAAAARAAANQAERDRAQLAAYAAQARAAEAKAAAAADAQRQSEARAAAAAAEAANARAQAQAAAQQHAQEAEQHAQQAAYEAAPPPPPPLPPQNQGMIPAPRPAPMAPPPPPPPGARPAYATPARAPASKAQIAALQRAVGVSADGVVGPKTLAAVSKRAGRTVSKTELQDAATVAAITQAIQSQAPPAPTPRPTVTTKPPKAPKKPQPKPKSTVSTDAPLAAKQAAVLAGQQKIVAFTKTQVNRVGKNTYPASWARQDMANYRRDLQGGMGQDQFWAMPMSMLQQRINSAVSSTNRTIADRIDLYAMTPAQYAAKHPGQARPRADSPGSGITYAEILALQQKGFPLAGFGAPMQYQYTGPAYTVLS